MKEIIGIALVAFIIGGFIFLQIRNRKNKQFVSMRGEHCNDDHPLTYDWRTK